MKDIIQPKSTVTLNFSIELEDGTLVESTWKRQEPVQFVIGDGNFPPSFEKNLLGMEINQEAAFTLRPEDGFGHWEKGNLKTIPIQKFPEDITPEKGLVVDFELPNRQSAYGVITDINDELIFVDFNHPLAGEHVLFKVEVIAIENRS